MLMMQPMAASMLPSRCIKCMALAKGFADRSVSIDEVNSGKKKQKPNKKASRREHISHELQQLQMTALQTSVRAPLAPTQHGNSSKPRSASPAQQQHSPEEVASLAKDLQEEVLRLQQDVRKSEFFR